MSRLPIPGSDDSTWGNILNDFLDQSLNSDGSLKSSAVLAAGAEITSNKGVPSGYSSLDGTGKVPLAQLSDATGVSKGVIQLSGDLGGTAASPTVPGLASTEKSVNKGQPNGYAGLDSSGLINAGELPFSVANTNWFTHVLDPLEGFTVQQGTWTMQSGGGTWSICNSTDWLNNGVGSALNDSISTTVDLDAGTYELDVTHWTIFCGGIVTIELDGVTIGAIDTYGGDSPGILTAFSGIVVSSSGSHTVLFKVTGQNASSSAYCAPIQQIVFIKTG